jgi:hypothetical protein
MKAVLRAVLDRYELEPTTAALEPPRRRSITVHPAAGARIVLRERARSLAPV